MIETGHALVSVVIPTLNEGEWVRRTVDAVLSQADGVPLEVVIADDGSTDGSCEGPWPPSVRVISAPGRGVAAARNAGAAQATASNLVFLDAHVLPSAGWIAELLGMLSDPGVAQAGLAVSDIGDPTRVGYTCVFVDELLHEGWADRTATEPYDSPCMIGCCMGIRTDVFNQLGGFDGGMKGWGVEDVEFSIHAWLAGYRCVVSPRATVAHRFKTPEDRRFAVEADQYDYNVLRCAMAHFDGAPLWGVIKTISEHPGGPEAISALIADSEFQQRVTGIQASARFDDAWYFARFRTELAPFEARIRSLVGPDDRAPRQTCGQCGARTAGLLSACLRCGTALPLPAAVAIAPAPELAVHPVPATPAVAAEVAPCPECGEPVAAEARFCGACGAATTPEAPAPATAPQPQARVCPNCGRAASAVATFCAGCGSRLAGTEPIASAPESRPASVCSACGTTLRPGARFCRHCGQPVG